MSKALIFDSGTLINLSMNGLLDLLPALKEQFKGKFLITKNVKYETVDRPIGIKRFELGALQVQNLIDSGTLELPSSIGVSEETLNSSTNELMDIANHYLQVKGQWVQIVSPAEMSCLALSSELKKQGIMSIIAIDERTTRLLAEKPQNLEQLMSEKIHQRVQLVASNFTIFSQYRFIRSSEIVYVAYKKGLIPLKGKKVLEALLYATKFKGSAISIQEIEELKKL